MRAAAQAGVPEQDRAAFARRMHGIKWNGMTPLERAEAYFRAEHGMDLSEMGLVAECLEPAVQDVEPPSLRATLLQGEEGTLLRVECDGDPRNVRSVCFAIDSSGSMTFSRAANGQTYKDRVVDVLPSVLDRVLEEGVHVKIVCFDHRTRVLPSVDTTRSAMQWVTDTMR